MSKNNDEKTLTGANLKMALWGTLNDLREKKITPAEADSIATQSREIIRVVKTQQSILKQGELGLTAELINFASNK